MKNIRFKTLLKNAALVGAGFFVERYISGFSPASSFFTACMVSCGTIIVLPFALKGIQKLALALNPNDPDQNTILGFVSGLLARRFLAPRIDPMVNNLLCSTSFHCDYEGVTTICMASLGGAVGYYLSAGKKADSASSSDSNGVEVVVTDSAKSKLHMA